MKAKLENLIIEDNQAIRNWKNRFADGATSCQWAAENCGNDATNSWNRSETWLNWTENYKADKSELLVPARSCWQNWVRHAIRHSKQPETGSHESPCCQAALALHWALNNLAQVTEGVLIQVSLTIPCLFFNFKFPIRYLLLSLFQNIETITTYSLHGQLRKGVCQCAIDFSINL